MNDLAAPFWFAIYTLSRHEKSVAAHLTQKGIDHLLPLYKTVHRWKNRTTVQVELPLFPNYVFVSVRPHLRWQVLDTPGVISLVGSSQGPWPIPLNEIEVLRRDLGEHGARPHPFLKVGQPVRITKGALSGLKGFLERINGSARVVLSVDMIERSVAVEVDSAAIEMAVSGSTPTYSPAYPC